LADERQIRLLYISLFIRLSCHCPVAEARRHELTHFSRERGTASSSESLGVAGELQFYPPVLLKMASRANAFEISNIQEVETEVVVTRQPECNNVL
jgi:hypothetical protein